MKQESKRWLDHPTNVDRLYYALVAVCTLLLLSDLFYEKQVHSGWERWFGFYGWFGFTAFFLLVLAGKRWRKVVGRKEDHYDG